MTITYHPVGANRQFACYLHTMNDQPLYVGACRLSELMDAPDARQNSEWNRCVVAQSAVTLTIVSEHPTLLEAETAALIHALTVKAYCNLNGQKVIEKRGNAVMCIDTGEEFATAAEAAKILKLSTSNLSNHLNGKAGFHTVKGKRFKWIK